MKSKYYRTYIGFTLLFLFVLIIYSNSFKSSWHLDDYPNIVDNPKLHINNLHPSSILETFYSLYDKGSYQSEKLYRPIPCLTFALNWYFDKNNVAGYHIINILIHIVTAFILFFATLQLFKTPALKQNQNNIMSISLLSTVLWAIQPVHVQAVTYIVQRMASMAAMFYILSIYFFLKGRNSDLNSGKKYFFTACFLSYIFAFFSKENAVILPLTLVLIEIVFYEKFKNTDKRIIWICFGSGMVLFALSSVMLLKGDIFSFLSGYDTRPFTMSERLLTQPRILIFYLSQLFYPVSTRISIHHDVIISRSLFDPLTTFPSIIAVAGIIGLGIYWIRKYPVFSFAVLFFFLNHAIESSIIPLELIFDHRNYLPSFFLFLPVASGIYKLLDYYEKEKRVIYYSLILFMVCLLTGIGISTYTVNIAWATEKTLWEDAMEKAPNSFRPPHNLAWYYYEKIGRYDIALELYKKSLSLTSVIKIKYKALAFNNIANIYYRFNNYDMAIKYYKEALKEYTGYAPARFNMIYALLLAGIPDEALKNIEILLKIYPDNIEYLKTRGFILLKSGQVEDSIQIFNKALEMAPDDGQALMNMGIALSMSNLYEKAEYYLKKALSYDRLIVLFSLIENRLKADDINSAEKYSQELLNSFNFNAIINRLKENRENILGFPISEEMIALFISDRLNKKADRLSGQGCLKYPAVK